VPDVQQPELVVIGRVGVDLYPQQTGALEDASTFAKSVGGSAANVAVAAARLGRHVALISKTGDDRFGHYLWRELGRFGIDTRWVTTTQECKTPLTFAELDPPEDPGLEFYREPTAPDLLLDIADIDAAPIDSAALLWVTGTGFSQEPSRTATQHALEQREGRPAILDLDWRPTLWERNGGPTAAGEALRAAIEHSTIVVGNRVEVAVALDGNEQASATMSPDDAADRLLELGVERAIVKCGGDGVYLASADERVMVAPIPVDVVCGLGAGDAFGGALCHGVLEGWGLERIGRFANAAGAWVVARLACADEMPTMEQVESLLEEPVEHA
jgi:5-dehydro-2-deoxygluconokinase